MIGLAHREAGVGHKARHAGIHALGVGHQGALEVDEREEAQGRENVVERGTHGGGEFLEYAYDFAAFSGFQFAYLVVGLHHGGRFDEHGLARCALVVHNAFYLLFQGRCHGNHEAAVAERGADVAVDVALGAGLVDDAAEGVGDAARIDFYLVADREEFGRGGIFHLAIFVKHLVDTFHDIGEHRHIGGHRGERGIERRGCFVFAFFIRRFSEQRGKAFDGCQRAFEIEKVLLFHISALRAYAQQRFAHVEEVSVEIRRIFLKQAHELRVEVQGPAHLGKGGEKLKVSVYPFCAER